MNVNNKWLWLSAVITGVTLGVAMLAFNIDFTINTIGPLAIGVFAVYMIIIIWTSVREQRNIIKILMVEGQPDLYLQRMNLLKKQIEGTNSKD